MARTSTSKQTTVCARARRAAAHREKLQDVAARVQELTDTLAAAKAAGRATLYGGGRSSEEILDWYTIIEDGYYQLFRNVSRAIHEETWRIQRLQAEADGVKLSQWFRLWRETRAKKTVLARRVARSKKLGGKSKLPKKLRVSMLWRAYI